MHGTLWNTIFTSLIGYEIDVIDTLRFNNGNDFLYRLATVLEMRLNHEYWWEVECTWQTNSINKITTSDRRDSWASSHWRGIDLVFKSIDCFTVRPIFSTRLITRMKSFSLFFISFYLFYLFLFWGRGGLAVCVCVCVGGGCAAPLHFLFGAIYRSQGRRWY